MPDILSEIFNLVEAHAPETPHDAALKQAFRDTLTDREALFRFLLHTP